MTEATMPRPDGIHYHVEELPENRGQLVADVVACGRLARTYRFGSPAPLQLVRKAAAQLNRFPRPDSEASQRRSRPTTTAAR